MDNVFTNVEAELIDFIQRCHQFKHSVEITTNQSSIQCLTDISYERFTFAIDYLNAFLDSLSSYTSDLFIEYDRIISIVFHCSHLVNYINVNQYLFVEYAIDDYLYLDESCDLIYQKIVEILNHLNSLKTIDIDIYNLNKTLGLSLPSIYLHRISPVLSSQITSTLLEKTSQTFLSSYNSLLNNQDDDNHDCIISPSFLFSSVPITISFENSDATKTMNDSYHYTGSLVQLDKINFRTSALSQSPRLPTFRFDTIGLEQITSDISENAVCDWINIEHKFSANIISVWLNKHSTSYSINPWSSETLWTLLMHLKCSDIDLNNKFNVIIQWSTCLLTIQAFNRDWDKIFSKALINVVMSNRWRIVKPDSSVHLSIVGHKLTELILRLQRVASVLQYMKLLSDRLPFLIVFYSSIKSSYINHFMAQIKNTFQLLTIWLHQHADTYINGNSLERTLVICNSDQKYLSRTIDSLQDALSEHDDYQSIVQLIESLRSSCDIIANETMLKLYRRIHFCTKNYFCNALPQTTDELQSNTTKKSPMKHACDKFLKPILSQCECLNVDNKREVYERIFSSFVEAWTSVLCERKYQYSDDMGTFLRQDYEHLRSFLSLNISDEEIVQSLNKSSSVTEISSIIDLLKQESHNGLNTSVSNLPNHDKWFRSRKSSSRFLQFLQYICCCQRVNRVTSSIA